MLPSFLPFLVLGEGSHLQCWFLLLRTTCILHAHELSLLQIHQWLLMAIYDLGPWPSARQVLLGQEKALGGKMKVGKPAILGEHVDFEYQLLCGMLITGRTFFRDSGEWCGAKQVVLHIMNAPNSPGLSRPWPPKGVCFGTMELEFEDLPFSWRSPMHWDGFPEEVPGLLLPSLALSGSSLPSC